MSTFKPIDLSGLNDDLEASNSIRAQIAEACDKNGFFQVINHGVPVEDTEKLREVSHKFFDLSEEEKLACPRKPEVGRLGYGRHMTCTDSEFQHWREVVEIQTLPLSGREYEYWPQQPADLGEAVEKYTAAVLDLAHRLLAVISENLGLKPAYLRDALGYPNIQQTITFQFYPPCPEPEKTLGMQPHSDIGGITIVMQEAEGLQVFDELNDTWELVPHYPNAFVVNIADQTEIITNGRYKSSNHRVIANSERTRRSYVTHYHPGLDHKVFPAPELVDAKVGPRYREFLYKEYLQAMRVGRVLEKRLLQSFAINNSVIS
ncbi:hypothetical protein O6H91_04G000700 [Diphasiastrum complanatum]|uniref:Uncharacterized protein n=1 Tax=Diphasiastrum complanatum TaxID=34168 RepID=A0ACC2DUC9_DIPCM|nr:hypothetical protein O6H91_04G000700 [Diphasiastrum complanatum]